MIPPTHIGAQLLVVHSPYAGKPDKSRPNTPGAGGGEFQSTLHFTTELYFMFLGARATLEIAHVKKI